VRFLAALVPSLVAAIRCPGLLVALSTWQELPALVAGPGALAGWLLLSPCGLAAVPTRV